MSPRLNLYALAQKPLEQLLALEKYLTDSGLEHGLLHLVKMRASQINGCAYCLHMHSADALKAGEDPKRLFLLDAWRESSLYSPRERAALGWTEALTRVAETHAPDEDFQALKPHFSDQQIADLTLAIGLINTWNRLAIGLRSEHPKDKPARETAAA
ncbi:MAG TPA: carboxymuconolactone decarboxylase family protein [Phenylobacterium sp.]|uniref:carboxymuconolactone decarboxylase family protein n=1 Tax=Phenylobacterium sp. TaxID=1871053 RepID=UPI002BE12187|nr:carboxymuconolactone decarboxylase family protein [Phenylobacterium sp.]HSV02379.1 carboxymuconolactone decarboxylase family protein [Phenylobacterium sp.]